MCVLGAGRGRLEGSLRLASAAAKQWGPAVRSSGAPPALLGPNIVTALYGRRLALAAD